MILVEIAARETGFRAAIIAGLARPAGRHHTVQRWADVLRTLATAFIAAITGWTGDPARTAALAGWHVTLGIIVGIGFIRALSHITWPRKPARHRTQRHPGRAAVGAGVPGP